ncbi:MAG: 2-oxoacid:acceptor oxidoreductase subunit alpha [Candidatus Methanomethylicia archaeon]
MFLGETFFMSGNDACVEGAIAAGCRFFAGYPITPANEIAERMSRRMFEVGGTFIQMEDEIASICAVIGASWTGLKAMTATSGPGFSLMQEGIGYAIATETPCVIVNVQRIGPSTGSIFSQQGDVMQARWGTHSGCYESIVLSPYSVQEMFSLTIESFNLSEEFRVPVILLSEAAIGHLRERLVIPDKINIVNRRKPTVSIKDFKPFEALENEAPPMASFGGGYRVYYTGHLHTVEGFPVLSLEKYPLAEKVLKRISSKIRLNIHRISMFDAKYVDDAKVIIVSYGSSARAVLRAVNEARKNGIKAGYVRLITLWPFNHQKIRELCNYADVVIVAEVNNGQILYEVQKALPFKNVIPLLKLVDTHTPIEVLAKIREVI